MKNLCPFCQLPIGYNRCRAFEKVLQSIILSCRNAVYGCQEALSYSKRGVHEKTCIYAPFLCPFPDCGLLGSLEQLKVHLSNRHGTPVMRFLFDSVTDICLEKTDDILIFQEESKGKLFILSCDALNSGSTHVGNIVAVNSIGSSLSDKEFHYDLHVHNSKSCIKLGSMTNRIVKLDNRSPVTGHFFVPAEFFSSAGMFTVKLTVWQDRTSQCMDELEPHARVILEG